LRRLYRPLVVAVAALTALAATLAAGPPTIADGPLLELLIKARSLVSTPPAAPETSPVVVVALDRGSLDSEELADIPRVLMTPVWGAVLEALGTAGARAIGFDVIFAFSGNRFRPDFDTPFLEALAHHRKRVVLARSAETLPDLSFLGALRANESPDALGLATILPDSDGTLRRVRAADEQTGVPGLAAAVLRRGHGREFPREVLLAPRRHLETIPTYAMVDVLRCAKLAPGVLARAVGGKVVLVGGTLPEEDRKTAAGRLLTPPTGETPPLDPCGLRRLPASAPYALNVPGVFVHAAAIEAVLSGRLTSTVPVSGVAAVAGGTAASGAALAVVLPPYLAVVVLLLVGAALFAAATAALANDLWVPIAMPLVALVAAPAGAYAVRYLVEERRRRRIQHAFSHYLSPRIVERLARERSALSLGGERRDVTVMFADLSGFTWLSGQLEPEALTSLTNRYLEYIVDQVEATGGYVDKFIGDAVMAIWGAPLTDARHALNGVGAALAAATRVREEARQAAARGDRRYFVKIGINSGPAIVGNVGSKRRFNYTAVGETVNIASRLEALPGIYGCQVVLGPATADLVHEAFLLRELDEVLVRGRETTLRIYQPIARRETATAEQVDRVERYAEALAEYRAGRFAEAALTWDTVAKGEEPAGDETDGDAQTKSPSRVMAARARQFLEHPPEPPWSGVWVVPVK
jgi:class 3 adenylate cyclase/CHASE2 domain-containing sensor protein